MAASEAELQQTLHNRILEALGAKHREFETLTELLEEVVFRCDSDGRLTLLNSAWMQKTGWTVEETLGTRLRDYIKGGEIVHELSSQFNGAELISLDVIIPCKDAQEKIFTLKARRSADHWYGSLHDISDLRNTVKALQNSRAEERKLSLVASGTDNLVIITDPQGYIEWVNQAFIDVTGLDLADVEGKTPGSVLQGPDSESDAVEIMRDGVEQGTGFNVDLINYDKSGQPYWIAIDCTPIFDCNGKLTNFIAIERVVTEEKQAEETLRESEQHYRSILDTVTEPIFYCNADFVLQYTNPAWTQMTGHAVQDDKDVSLCEFIHPEDVDTLLLAKKGANGRESQVKQELRLRDVSSCWRRVEIQVSSNRPSQYHHCQEFTGAIVDVDERWQETQAMRTAKKEAEDLSRARTRFIANMSHEIRTPLNAIIGMTSVLQQTHLDKDQSLCVETLANGGKALLGLVNDVLDLSKLDSTELQLECTEFELSKICEEAADIIAASVEEKNLTLTMSCASSVPQFLLGDPHRLRQVLLNLLVNAVKFTAFGGIKIRISWQAELEDLGSLHVDIVDSGIGIPIDRVDTLFDAFTQADPSTTRQFGGTGLGLAICRQICHAMDGEIAVQSELGRGSRFSFQVPLRCIEKPLPTHEISLQGVNLDARNREVVESLSHCLKVPCDYPSSEVDTGPCLNVLKGGNAFTLALDATLPVLTPQRLWNRLEKLLQPSEPSALLQTALHATPMKILIAEDAIPNQLVADAMLKQLGYRDVTIVDNGKIAVERCQVENYDIILLDLHMPVMDGITAAVEIRQNANGNHRPLIIAASADVTTEAQQAADSAGFDNWLAKPFTRDALSKVLRNAVETTSY